MNVDLILTEWCYRLPKGHPTSAKDYEVLYDVLLEMADVTPEYARQIVERAKGEMTHLIMESLAVDSIENQFLQKAINEANKVNEFREFLRLLPTEADMITLQFLNNLSYEESQEFATLLYSESSIDETTLDSINFKTGIAGKLFNLKPDGMGKGEIYLSVLTTGTQAQGGGKSFDLVSNGKYYEVKDYSNPKKKSASIRLGTKGTVTRFKFWNEITATFQRISQLKGIDKPKFNLNELLPAPLLEAIAYLESRREFILAGNLNLKDQHWLERFYHEAHQLNSEIQGYTNVILRGPNAEPIEMSIEPITDASGDAFVIRPIRDDSRNLIYVNTELRRLKYVRQPYELARDMQEAVNSIVDNNITFIVFRPHRVNVTQDFRYAVTDAGKIRIIEKDIIPNDDIEESVLHEDED
jgi:hypothetical protein